MAGKNKSCEGKTETENSKGRVREWVTYDSAGVRKFRTEAD